MRRRRPPAPNVRLTDRRWRPPVTPPPEPKRKFLEPRGGDLLVVNFGLEHDVTSDGGGTSLLTVVQPSARLKARISPVTNGASRSLPPASAEPGSEPVVLTVGHSTRPVAEFIALLQAHSVARLIDVRTVPRSRHNPQFDRDTLPAALAPHGIAYEHVAGLGGFRRPHPASLNIGWRNRSFRGYADYMGTPEFGEHLADLIAKARRERIALMCAEAVPWRCHRSLIADALVVLGIRVAEIISATRLQTHTVTPFACVHGTTITYPPASSSVTQPSMKEP